MVWSGAVVVGLCAFSRGWYSYTLVEGANYFLPKRGQPSYGADIPHSAIYTGFRRTKSALCCALLLLACLDACFNSPPLSCRVVLGSVCLGQRWALRWMGAGERIPYVARKTEWIGLQSCWGLSVKMVFATNSRLETPVCSV